LAAEADQPVHVMLPHQLLLAELAAELAVGPL
jgi:hypothetical protein